MAFGIVVEYINEQWQLCWWGARLQRIGALLRSEACRVRLGQLSQGERQIGSENSPFAPRPEMLLSWWKYLDAAEHGHSCGHPAHWHANTGPMWIDRNGSIQRPCRCNCVAGLAARVLDRGMQCLKIGNGLSGVRRIRRCVGVKYICHEVLLFVGLAHSIGKRRCGGFWLKLRGGPRRPASGPEVEGQTRVGLVQIKSRIAPTTPVSQQLRPYLQ